MDVVHWHHGTTFTWNADKARRNARRHGVRFEEAVTVFDDPLFVVKDASRRGESRQGVVGFGIGGRLLYVVHLEVEAEYLRIISARRATKTERRLYDQ